MARRKLFNVGSPNKKWPMSGTWGPPKASPRTEKKATRKRLPSDEFQLDKEHEKLTKSVINGVKDPSFKNVAPFVQTHRKRDFTVKTSLGVNLNVGRITPPTGLSTEEEGKHIKIEHNTNVTHTMIGTDNISIYRKKVETGVPSSNALLRVAKENGTTTRVLFDTKTSSIAAPNHYSREQLSLGTGFEQKGYTLFDGNTWLNYKDVSDEAALSLDAGTSPRNYQKVTASLLNSRTEMKIRNQSAYHKAYVKIHLLKYTPSTFITSEDPLEAMFGSVFYNDLSSGTTPEDTRQKVPLGYQYTPGTLEFAGTGEGSAPNQVFHVDVHQGKPVIRYSPYFKEHFEICGSYGKNLGPGDFFNFTHIHHFGNGFDLSKIMALAPNTIQEDSLQFNAVSYIYLVEYRGTQCEINYNNGTTQDNRIGTSPVILNCEIRKKLTYCNAEKPVSALTEFGMSPLMHIKYADNDLDYRVTTASKHFNLPVKDWSTAAPPAAGKYCIQVASDRALVTSAASAGGGGGTEIQDFVP